MTIIIGVLVGSAAGLLAGILGLGGGVLIPPLLALILGLDQHAAQAASLAALVPPVGYPALLGYQKNGVKVPWRLVSWLVGSFAAGGVVGGVSAQWIPSRSLRWAFVAVLVGVALRSVLLARRPAHAHAGSRVARMGFFPAAAIGGLGGVISGLFGIGGGVMILPLLQRWARVDRLTAQVTTLAMMLFPIGLPAVVVYALAHPLPWMLLVSVASGFVLGAWIGGRVATRVPHAHASYLFAAVVVFAAVMMLLKN
jgi:uncharacterized protein